MSKLKNTLLNIFAILILLVIAAAIVVFIIRTPKLPQVICVIILSCTLGIITIWAHKRVKDML